MTDIRELESDQIDRVRLVEQIFVMYPRLGDIRDLIMDCHQVSKVTAEPQCMFLTGGAGVGKTSLIQQYLV